MNQEFHYNLFPKEPLWSKYSNVGYPVLYQLELKTSSTPLYRNPKYGYEKEFVDNYEKDIINTLLVNPYEHITLNNLFYIETIKYCKKRKELDNISIPKIFIDKDTFWINKLSFTPVVKTYEFSNDIQYMLQDVIGSLNLVSGNPFPQKYMSFESITPCQIQNKVIKPLTDFVKVISKYRSRKITYNNNDEYDCYYSPFFSQEKIEYTSIENTLKDEKEMKVNQTIQTIQTSSDIKNIHLNIQHKMDMVYIRNISSLPSIYYLSEHKMIHRFFIDMVTSMSVLKKNGNILCYFDTIFLDPTVEIIYMVSQHFKDMFIYRSVLSDVDRFQFFIVFRKFNGINQLELDKMYEIVDKWYEYDNSVGYLLNVKKQDVNNNYEDFESHHREKFITSVVKFKNGISDHFRTWVRGINEKIGLLIVSKRKQIIQLGNYFKHISSEKKEALIKYMLEQNSKISMNWCHTMGVIINPFYDKFGDSLLTNMEYIEKLFPIEANIDMKKLQISKEGIFSITKPKEAELITKIIMKHLKKHSNNTIITDATSNVGGNVINFTKHFQYVNAVEVSPLHCNILKNNVEVYKRNNVKVYCNDYLDIYRTIKQDVIFIDPPWGGSDYKTKRKLNLFLSGEPLSSILNRLNGHANLFVIKAPKNIDLQSIFNESYFKTYTVYKIRNYLLIIFENVGKNIFIS